MKVVEEGLLAAIGHTPLVRLRRFFDEAPFRLYAKLEALNPGGSVKDRAAHEIITQAIKAGHIRPGTVVIESSSGNMGIGLAQACSYYNLRFICVIDPKTTAQNIKIMQAYGAELDSIAEPDPATGEYLGARLARVEALAASLKDSFWPNQYSNLNNVAAHHRTMDEIALALGRPVDYLFCATSTCGTLRGCAEYVRARNHKTRIIAVDAVGSVIFGGSPRRRLIPGHGAAIRPRLYQPDLADECIHVTDLECVIGCRRLVRREAILAGGSSGAALMAVEKMKRRILKDAVCVVILPDRGERYLDTIYSDVWVRRQFGDVALEKKHA